MEEDENEWMYILGIVERPTLTWREHLGRKITKRKYDHLDLRPYPFQELDQKHIYYYEKAKPDRRGSDVLFVKEQGYLQRGKPILLAD